MKVDASGGLLATGGADRAVFVWDVERGYCTHAFRGHAGVVTAVVFNIDRKRLLLFSGGDDATIRVWDLVKKKCVVVLEKHFSTITSLVVSTSSDCLLSAGRDKVVNVWNMQDFSLQTTVPVYEPIEAVCIVPDGSELLQVCNKKKLEEAKVSGAVPVWFLTVGERGIIRIWLAEGATCVYEQVSSDPVVVTEKEEEKRGFVGAALLPSAEGVMCITSDQRLLFYHVIKSDAGDCSLGVMKRLIGNNDEVTDLKFVSGEANLLAVATNLEQIRIYDLRTATCRQELFGHKDIVLCLDSCIYSSSITLLASGGKDHSVRLWNVGTGHCVAIAEGHMAAVGALAFSKKTKKFLVSGSSDHTIKVWSATGFEDRASKDWPVLLSSLATVAAHDKDINSIAIAPNDSLVCTGSQDRTARIWRLPELVLGVTLRGHKKGIWSVQFSPVDQCVLTASGDKTVRIWALSDGSCLKTFEGHTSSVLKASFLSRGMQVISAGADGLLKLWTIKANECINTFDRHEDKIWALDVRATDEMLATGGSDSVINLWMDSTQEDEEEALRKEEEETLKDQDLSNALANTDYATALQLAFELKRPFKLLNVFFELFRSKQMGMQVHNVLKKLDKEHLRLLLSYVREWNTKPKFCHAAQRVLAELFYAFPPKELLEVSGLRELIEGILPYTERHFNRLDRLHRSTFLLDYTLASMSVLNPLETHNPSIRQSNTNEEDTFSTLNQLTATDTSNLKQLTSTSEEFGQAKLGSSNRIGEGEAIFESEIISVTDYPESETLPRRKKKKQRKLSISETNENLPARKKHKQRGG
ncbi:hypothetical protein GOP47_0015324 [Adiantum capillus-veneris]|nr:hypothetical protein GOP47_0015324 [Adiantum capillus-veneris]